MGELATLENPVEIAAERKTDLLSIIAAAAINPQVDVEKMRALLAMKERIDENDAKALFNRCMIDAQEEMRPVVKDRINDHTKSKYATLEAVDRAIRPIYIKHGFALTWGSRDAREGYRTVTCDCLHRGGYSKAYELTGALDIAGSAGNKNKTGIQAGGSTDHYLRRYLESMIFNVIFTDMDIDGEPEVEYITADQQKKIAEIILANHFDKSLVLGYVGAKSIAQIQADKLDGLMAALRKKIADKQGAKPNA